MLELKNKVGGLLWQIDSELLHVNIKKKNQHFNKMKIPNALDVITFPSTVNAKKSVRELVEFPFSFPDTGVTD